MSDAPHLIRPALRPGLEAVPAEAEGVGPVFVLKDALRLARPMVVPAAGLAVAELLDGTRELEAVHEEMERRYGFAPSPAQLRELVGALDEACLLCGPRVDAAFRAFREAPAREPACIGSYPGDPAELRAFLAEQWTREGGPGGAPGPIAGPPLRALISPHIDPHRGGHAYAWAWRAVAEAPPADLYVIFGTSHTGTAPLDGPPRPGRPAPLYALTRKTFQTPLGDVPVDLAALERLLAAYEGPDDLFAGELHHRGEHSIEFQALYLRAVSDPARTPRILPILCGGLHELVAAPSQDPRLQAFHAALRKALAPLDPARVCFVAGIDLAHVGEQFGEEPVSAEDVARLGELDRRTLSLATEQRAPDAVDADIRRGGDPRNICGHAPLVAMLEAVRGEALRGDLLYYGAWHDGASAVSFASAAYRPEEGP